MPARKRKSLVEALKGDKYLLPVINVYLIVFLGFITFSYFVGFEEAMGAFGFFATLFIGTILTTLGKNVVEWYYGAPMGTHIWFFVMLVTITFAFIKFFYPSPRKSK